MNKFRYDRNKFGLNKSKELISHHIAIYSTRPLHEWAIAKIVKASTERGFSILDLKRVLKRDISAYGMSYAGDAGSLTVVHVY